MAAAPVPTAEGSSLFRSIHHLREQLAQLRMLGPIPLVVVESPAGSKTDDDDAIVASLKTVCGDAGSPLFVAGMVDPGRGGTVSIHVAAHSDPLWSRFRRVADAAHRVASRYLVELRLLDATEAVAGSWVVDVARTLARLKPADPCPVRLHGETVWRWTSLGHVLVGESAVQNPIPLLAKLCEGVSSHRYLLLDDAVEASVAVLDLLVVRLEAVDACDEQKPPAATAPPGRKGEKGEKGEKAPSHRLQGRPRKTEGATRKAEAAWWRDHVHMAPEISDRWNSDRLDQLFELMMEAEFEIRLYKLGAEEPPDWWPTGPRGRRVNVVQFRERWKTVKPKYWAAYIRRFDNDAALGRQITPRHHQRNVEPPAKPEPAAKITPARAAICALEDAADIASDLFHAHGKQRGKLLDKLRGTLERAGLIGDNADELLDLEPELMVAEFGRRRRLVEESQAETQKLDARSTDPGRQAR